LRQSGFFLRRSHIGEQQAAELRHGIGGVLDFVFEAGLRGFKGLLYAFTAWVVFPSMIDAADAILLDKSVVKGRAAMGAVLANETVCSALIPEQHEILTEDPYPLFWFLVAELRCCRNDVPIASEQLARRCFRTDAGKELVLFLTEHGIRLLSALAA